MPILFITGPEGSGTSALVRALTNHPSVVKGDAARYGNPTFRSTAGAQLIPAARMSTLRAGDFDVAGAEARRQLEENAAALFAMQPEARAIFFKYSTPALRPKLWPVFLPLFEIAEFRVVVIWRRPLDSIYSAFRRFYGDERHGAIGFFAAAGCYAQAVRHIRRQLAQSPRERCLNVRYERLVAEPEATLREIYALAELDYRPVDELLPGRGFSNENGKWKQALRKILVGGNA